MCCQASSAPARLQALNCPTHPNGEKERSRKVEGQKKGHRFASARLNNVELLIFAPTSLSSPNHPLALQSLCHLVRFLLAQSDFMSGWGPAAYSLHVAFFSLSMHRAKKTELSGSAVACVAVEGGEQHRTENKQVKRVMGN